MGYLIAWPGVVAGLNLRHFQGLNLVLCIASAAYVLSMRIPLKLALSVLHHR